MAADTVISIALGQFSGHPPVISPEAALFFSSTSSDFSPLQFGLSAHAKHSRLQNAIAKTNNAAATMRHFDVAALASAR